jgi:citrate synthase
MAGKPSRGLADVVVASTAVSDIDGRAGRLAYRGYDVADLAGAASFEEVAFLLQRGVPPGPAELAAYAADLAAGQRSGPVTLASLPAVARAQPPMAALRTLVSLSAADAPAADAPAANAADVAGAADAADPGSARRLAAWLTGQQAALVPAVAAAAAGRPPPEPDPGLSLAGRLLAGLTGRSPAASPAARRAAEIFDACLVLHAEHLMAGSTFAARVCAATRADMPAAVTAALATLAGPLHGGANEQVSRDLDGILAAARVAGADPAAAAADHVAARLRRGEPVTGFGHRAYRGEDPRATCLRDLSAELAAAGDDTWYRMARRAEEVVLAERGLYPNADFYAAVAYQYLGIPAALRTAVLSAARMAGWTAHVLEQHADNRLIRPGGEYVGEAGLRWVPLAER